MPKIVDSEVISSVRGGFRDRNRKIPISHKSAGDFESPAIWQPVTLHASKKRKNVAKCVRGADAPLSHPATRPR
jgi:hypothetical protein